MAPACPLREVIALQPAVVQGRRLRGRRCSRLPESCAEIFAAADAAAADGFDARSLPPQAAGPRFRAHATAPPASAPDETQPSLDSPRNRRGRDSLRRCVAPPHNSRDRPAVFQVEAEDHAGRPQQIEKLAKPLGVGQTLLQADDGGFQRGPLRSSCSSAPGRWPDRA